jgi:hypothetical protein
MDIREEEAMREGKKKILGKRLVQDKENLYDLVNGGEY